MMKRPVLAVAVSAMLAGCSLAPAYHVPTSVTPTAAFKADPGWVPSNPSDAVAKGAWWTLFGDDTLNALEARVLITNQNLAYYRATYAQALSVVRVDQAALFPTAGVTLNADRNGTFSPYTKSTGFDAAFSASWTPDLWGALTNTKRQAAAQAQATAAQLANATLSAQGSLATDYFQLRGIDEQATMLDQTIVSYQRAYDVTRNKHAAGTASSADVDTAHAQLANAQAQRRDLDRQRVADETAIGVLVGENPSTFAIAKAPWNPEVPAVPGVVPSVILERRPDIANAERLVSAANSNIGIQRAAFFPTVTLTEGLGSVASSVGGLFKAAAASWSVGASLAETLLDFGARKAKVEGARAAYDATVATYRQTVLSAFQEVESDLASVAGYHAEAARYAEASQAADRAEKVTLNEYRAGTVDYTTVATAQATAYAARTTLIQNTVNEQSSAVALIQAIGGEWTGGVDLRPSTKAPTAQ